MNKKFKNKLIRTIVSIIVNILVFLINYLHEIKGLSVFFVISLCFVIFYILYWFYQLSKYCIYHLLFGNYNKLKKNKKIIYLSISIILFVFTIFVILIEKPKYSTLDEKLKEKNTIKDIKVLDKKTNQYVSYKNYDFSKDKEMTIFGIELCYLGNIKQYIIYKTDFRYELLKAYLEVFNMKNNKDKDIILSYLALSFQALSFYKKEVKDIKEDYNSLVKKYNKALQNKVEITDKDITKDEEYKIMLQIQKFLLDTKMNNIKYNEVISQMKIIEKDSELTYVKTWHNYFQNLSSLENIKVDKVLNEFNEHFKNEILIKYNNVN